MLNAVQVHKYVECFEFALFIYMFSSCQSLLVSDCLHELVDDEKTFFSLTSRITPEINGTFAAHIAARFMCLSSLNLHVRVLCAEFASRP